MKKNPLHVAWPKVPMLLLDASGPTTYVGLLEGQRWMAFYPSKTPALESLFLGVHHCLQQSDLSLEAVKGFLYCEGPGSILGLRLSVMALKTWRLLPPWQDSRLYAYRRLNIAAALHMRTSSLKTFSLIADFKHGSWHCLKVSEPDAVADTPITVVKTDALQHLSLPCYYLRQRSHMLPPIETIPIDYTLEKLPEILRDQRLFRRLNAPETYQTQTAVYQRWKPQRHQRPT